MVPEPLLSALFVEVVDRVQGRYLATGEPEHAVLGLERAQTDGAFGDGGGRGVEVPGLGGGALHCFEIGAAR